MMPQNNETVAMLVSKPILWRGGGGGGGNEKFSQKLYFQTNQSSQLWRARLSWVRRHIADWGRYEIVSFMMYQIFFALPM